MSFVYTFLSLSSRLHIENLGRNLRIRAFHELSWYLLHYFFPRTELFAVSLYSGGFNDHHVFLHLHLKLSNIWFSTHAKKCWDVFCTWSYQFDTVSILWFFLQIIEIVGNHLIFIDVNRKKAIKMKVIFFLEKKQNLLYHFWIKREIYFSFITRIVLESRPHDSNNNMWLTIDSVSMYIGRGENHSLEISGNLYNKSEIAYALGKNPFEKWEISYPKCWSDLHLDIILTQ